MEPRASKDRVSLLFLAVLMASVGTSVAPGQTNNNLPPTGPTVVIIHVQEPSSGPISVGALVRLSSMTVPNGFQGTSREGGKVTLNGIPLGEYTVEVTAPGYQNAREDLTV